MSSRDYPSAWAAVADHLARLGVDTIFGLPGDDMAILPALADTPLRLVLCRDQRNAVFMATGYALATGRPGACITGKGPAVTNAVTGLLEAGTARVPLLMFSAGTAGDRLGTGAFQELDQLAVVRPVTKWAARVDHPERLCSVLETASLIATTGTPGPVYVELPEPVGTAPVTRTGPWRARLSQYPTPAEDTVQTTYQRITSARRPILLVGGGARHRNQGRRIEQLAEAVGAGLATTASGRGTVDELHPQFCGLSGLYSPSPLAPLWQETDLVVALGSRLEETATFGWPQAWPQVMQVILGEQDASGEPTVEPVLADVGQTVDAWLALAADHTPTADPAWLERIRQARTDAELEVRWRLNRTTPDSVSVAELLTTLDRIVPADRVVVHENGLQDMWSYFFPYWICRRPGGTVAPSEQTSLGFGAAAAAGVALGVPDRPVVALVGDGAFQLFSPDLPTVAEAGAPVLYVVLHNGGYGWLHVNARQVPGGDDYHFLSPGRRTVAAVAEAAGLRYSKVTAPKQLASALHRAWRACAHGRSAVVEVYVDIRDVPPGLETLAGDFPAAPTSPAPLITSLTGGTQ